MLKIQDFKETNPEKQSEMKKKLKEFKLENIRSMWYFIRGGSKHTIVGSKGY